MNTRQLLTDRGIQLADEIESLRSGQEAVLDWARQAGKPYLLINAPTGSGKTLMLGLLGALLGQSWTYATHTIRLQEQVVRTFPNVPVVTGRGNHPCLIGQETHHRSDVTAAEGICTALSWCEYSGQAANAEWQVKLLEAKERALCDYYEQRRVALSSRWRAANYAYILADHKTFVGSGLTDVLLCDEAHNIDDAVCRAAEIRVAIPVYRRYGLRPPAAPDVAIWQQWAAKQMWFLPHNVGQRQAPDNARMNIRRQLESLRDIRNPDEWIIDINKYVATLRPLWGKTLAPRLLFGAGLERPPSKVVFSSATLIGGDYYAERLGLPASAWAYMELPHPFLPAHRPINYAPVLPFSAEATETPALRIQMQTAIDHIIEWYMQRGARGGLIHAVSNRYRDYMLTESRFRGMMVSDPIEHENRIHRGQLSVLVAANLLEGWDGADDLVRFIIMPKVPYGYLGDPKVRAQLIADPRSYDYAALIGVIQGAGRGVRHEEDYADTWILDRNWQRLYDKRKTWIPSWFKTAYHHGVSLPKE